MQALYRKTRSIIHRWRAQPSEPSFMAMVRMERRVADLAAQLQGIHRREVWDFNTKVGIKRVASRFGVRTPAILADQALPREISWDILPETFVAKPVWGAGGVGVRVLRRIPDGYHDAISGTSFTLDQLCSGWDELAASGLISHELIVEEVVGDGSLLPLDWKAYAFRGEVELILQVDRNGGKRIRYYDKHWNTPAFLYYGQNKNNGNGNGKSLPPPRHPEEIIICASKISRELPLPFIRVDLYEDDEGVLLGELTPRPGHAFPFRPQWDRHLGEAWERSEARLRIELDRYKVAT